MCLEGEVEMELTCEPAFDYGRVPAQWTVSDDGHTADASGADVTIRLQTDMAVGTEGERVRARHSSIRESRSSARCPGPRSSPHRRSRRGQRTPRRDRPLLAQLAERRPHTRPSLARSDPALGARDQGPNVHADRRHGRGADDLAAGDTGGERNWDYRYTWLRDSTFTLQALHYLNLDWEAEEFMQFVADLEPNDDGALQIMYGIDGRRDLTESTRDDLSG